MPTEPPKASFSSHHHSLAHTHQPSNSQLPHHHSCRSFHNIGHSPSHSSDHNSEASHSPPPLSTTSTTSTSTSTSTPQSYPTSNGPYQTRGTYEALSTGIGLGHIRTRSAPKRPIIHPHEILDSPDLSRPSSFSSPAPSSPSSSSSFQVAPENHGTVSPTASSPKPPSRIHHQRMISAAHQFVSSSAATLASFLGRSGGQQIASNTTPPPRSTPPRSSSHSPRPIQNTQGEIWGSSFISPPKARRRALFSSLTLRQSAGPDESVNTTTFVTTLTRWFRAHLIDYLSALVVFTAILAGILIAEGTMTLTDMMTSLQSIGWYYILAFSYGFLIVMYPLLWLFKFRRPSGLLFNNDHHRP